MAFVSIVMPVYNSGMFLGDSISSILSQSFRDFELLIFDDGSVDNSVDIAQSFADADDRIRLYRCNHAGYSVHLNRGIREASGRYIARMDSDDVCLNNRLSRQVEALEQNLRLVAVGTSVVLIDSEGAPFSVFQMPCSHVEIDKQNLIGLGGAIAHPSVMMRTSVVRSIGGYDESLEPAEDLDLWLRMAEVGLLGNLQEPLLKYRVHDKMVSQQKREQQRANALKAVAAACQRRGITQPTVLTESEQPLEGNVHLAQTRMRKSFQNGFPATAVKYAVRALKENYFSVEAWSILLRAGYASLRERSR